MALSVPPGRLGLARTGTDDAIPKALSEEDVAVAGWSFETSKKISLTPQDQRHLDLLEWMVDLPVSSEIPGDLQRAWSTCPGLLAGPSWAKKLTVVVHCVGDRSFTQISSQT